MKKKWVGFYDYTVILTYCGMLSSVAGIFYAIARRVTRSLLCLMLSGICDMFDGAVANTKKRTSDEKRFGIQIDSLSDLVSFGVLPAVFTFCKADESVWSSVICALFVLAALIRLSYYNVMEENRQDETEEARKSFLGMPVTTIALFLPLLYILEARSMVTISTSYQILLAVCGVLFLAPITVPKPQKLGKVFMALAGVLVLTQLLLLGI